MAESAAAVAASLNVPGARSRVRSRFFQAMSGVLLLVVLIGFSRTLYLRPAFDVPDIPAYLILHGIIMTAWFAGVFLQTTLVRVRKISVHRGFGWVLALLGVGMILTGAYVTFNHMGRRVAMGADVDTLMPAVSVIVWTNIGALMCFSILLSAALLARARVDWHKRLMLVGSISMISPAITRISDWPVFAGFDDPHLFRYCLMLLLFVPLFAYDYVTIKRPHAVTLVGSVGVMGVKAVFAYVISSTAVGLEIVRFLTL